ncbi:hypothetical protein BDN71DRAFT_1458872 [Pleurotus eryngii]|uniref:SET domain-containing protein n=1 Tax=Pleurotus eryngii TaxID=5323 RepID=A0A9P6D7X6_PLEER|nr:hypothetical protein BDN71DRAFT_1458872 [Pleurotus eryngii]
MYISACRAIPAGTELTMYYRDPFLPSSERRAALLAVYKFHCACPSCLSPASSDKRRLRESQHVHGRVLRHLMCIPYLMQMCAEGEEDDIGSNAEAEGYEGYKRMLRAWRLANGAEEVDVRRVELSEEEMTRVAVSRRRTGG